MEMPMSVEAFKPPNEKWKTMKAVWDACDRAGLEPPEEVIEYFNGESPDEVGVKVGDWGMGTPKLYPPWLAQWRTPMQHGFEIDTSKLPKDVSIVRFVCPW